MTGTINIMRGIHGYQCTSAQGSDIKELNEKIAAVENEITDSRDIHITTPLIENDHSRVSMAKTCKETPMQDVKQSWVLTGLKTALTSATGFASGYIAGKITDEVEKAEREFGKNTGVRPEASPEKGVITNNIVRPEASSERVTGFNVKSGELPDENQPFDEKLLNNGPFKTFSEKEKATKENERLLRKHFEKHGAPISIRHDIEKKIREYAKYDESDHDQHKGFPGDVSLKFCEPFDPYDYNFCEDKRTNVDIFFDPDSNVLKSFNLKIERDWECKYSHDKNSSYSVEDKGNYILYKRDDGDEICYQKAAVKYDKSTHKTIFAGLLD